MTNIGKIKIKNIEANLSLPFSPPKPPTTPVIPIKSTATAVETLDLDEEISTYRFGPVGTDGTHYYLQPDGRLVDINGVTIEENEERLKQIRQEEREKERLEQLQNIYVNSTGDFELTTDNQTYEVTGEDLLTLQSVVAAEALNDYDDALAVCSVIMNRCDEGNWGGDDPISVITAKEQFAAYFGGNYKDYFYGKDEIPETVIQAVNDSLNGVRNNNFLEFRSPNTSKFTSQVVEGGNKYGNSID